jgi:hypothetical protein
MGAWDITAFGNDDAADWSADLLESGAPADFLEQTLSMAKRPGYLEAGDGSLLVAAAAVVSAACGTSVHGLPDDLRSWLQGKESAIKSLAPAAQLAIQRVRGQDSELYETWQESDNLDP